MHHLKFISGGSYRDGVIVATEKKPDVFVDDAEYAGTLGASGFFALVEGEKQEADLPEEDKGEELLFPEDERTTADVLKEELEELTAKELKEYAEKHGIDLKGKTRKVDMINRITEAQSEADKARAALRE